jgi:transposase
MLMLPAALKILVCTQLVDFRCSFDGLANATRNLLAGDPLSGQLYVFFNRTGDQMRLLVWDGNGYLLIGKRLERARFRLPWDKKTVGQNAYAISTAELSDILKGIDLKGAKRLPRGSGHVPPVAPAS